MLKCKINAQKLVHFNFPPYLCIRINKGNHLTAEATLKILQKDYEDLARNERDCRARRS